MPSDDEGPGTGVSVEVGSVGIIIFVFLSICCGWAFLHVRSKTNKRLFGCTLCCCLLEIPRYICLVAERSYVDKTSYILHMLSSIFYFSAFSIVCYTLHDTIDLSKSNNLSISSLSDRSLVQILIFDKRTLIAANVILTFLVIMSSFICVTHKTLEHFFHYSDVYKIYTLYDALVNVVFATCLLYFGCRLRNNIIQVTAKFEGWSDETTKIDKMHKAIRSLLIVMIACFASFFIRTVMLIIKLLVIEMGHEQIPGFHAYGMMWWIFADFLPRSIPIATFLWFFGRTSVDASSHDNNANNTKCRNNNQYEYNFLVGSGNSVSSEDNLDVCLLDHLENEGDQQQQAGDERLLAVAASASNGGKGRHDQQSVDSIATNHTSSTSRTLAMFITTEDDAHTTAQHGSTICNTMRWSPPLVSDLIIETSNQ